MNALIFAMDEELRFFLVYIAIVCYMYINGLLQNHLMVLTIKRSDLPRAEDN